MLAVRKPGCIPCCECGVDILPNNAALCADCIKGSLNFNKEIANEILILHQCRDCKRYENTQKHWIATHRESSELLGVCLKKLKLLRSKDLTLIDAGFIWTEPHSKRLTVKMVLEKEGLGVKFRDTVSLTFKEENQMCPDCQKNTVNMTWGAKVQIRQKASHQRSILLLEQLIIARGAQKDVIGLEKVRGGLDFFFADRTSARIFNDFINKTVAARTTISKKMVSQDTRNNFLNMKYTYAVELVPVCKDDLVYVPQKVSKSLGCIGSLILCSKVSSSIHFINPLTLNCVEMSATKYFKDPVITLQSKGDFVEFVVLDIKDIETVRGKAKTDINVVVDPSQPILKDVEISPVDDFSVRYNVITHLGNSLEVGDNVNGYLLSSSVFNASEIDKDSSDFPDVILVRKVKENKGERKGKLKSLVEFSPEVDEVNPETGRMRKFDAKLEDIENVLEDIEDENMVDLLDSISSDAGLEEDNIVT